MLISILFAQDRIRTNLQDSIQDLEDSARTPLLVSIMIEGIVALVLLGSAALIYFKKIKGAQGKNTLWVVLALILGGMGILFLLGTIFGIISYLAAPAIVDTLTYR